MSKLKTTTIPSDWRSALSSLVSLVDASLEIQATRTSLSFGSKDAKAAFYRAVDSTAQAFVLSVQQELGAFSSQNIKAFRSVEQSLEAAAGIAEIQLPSVLAEYTKNPVTCMSNYVRTPLISLLQQGKVLDDYEATLRAALLARITRMDQCLYEAWLAYALIDSLEPVEFYTATRDENDVINTHPASDIRMGYQEPLRDYRLPEAVFTTKKQGTFAYKFEKHDELRFYGIPDKCKDFTAAGNTEQMLCRRTLLLYRTDTVDEQFVLARRSTGYVRTPLFMMEYLDAHGLPLDEALAQMRKRALLFKGAAPLAIALGEPAQEQAAEGAFADVPHVAQCVGYDKTKLKHFLTSCTATDYSERRC